MPHLCFCIDKPGNPDIRTEFMAEHLAYIETILDKVAVAGPLKPAADDDPDASCFIYHTESREEAMSLLHNDPYYGAGLWSSVICEYFLPAAGTWIGGKIW
ncbi:MAG TPA: YciI family protein [Xanthomonadales bacterium]|nr:YciI family protein [Xanthomonadales bacterium]